MSEKNPLLRDKAEKPERFWTLGLKALVLVNIVFLLVIGSGLVILFKAMRPSIEAYTQNLDLLK